MKTALQQIGIFGLIMVFGFVCYLLGRNSVKQNAPINSDTVYVKADTVKIPYNVFIKLPGKIDTVEVKDSLNNDVDQFIATADTTLLKDSSKISVKYYYPPLNFFEVDAELKERIIEKLKIVKETVLVESPWYDSFVVGVIATLITVLGLLIAL